MKFKGYPWLCCEFDASLGFMKLKINTTAVSVSIKQLLALSSIP